MFFIEIQRADKSSFQLRQKVQRASEESDMPADRFAAGETADGLIDHCLKNGGGEVFSRSALVDQRLNVGFGKHAAARRNRINGFIIFGIFVKSGGVGLNQRRHLIDKGARSAGTDAVHALLHIAALEIDNFCIFTAELDRDVRLGRGLLQGRGDGDDLLHKGDLKMLCQSQTARTGNHGGNGAVSESG